MDASGERLLKHPKYMIFNVTFKCSFIIGTIIFVLWNRAVQYLNADLSTIFFLQIKYLQGSQGRKCCLGMLTTQRPSLNCIVQ